MILEIKVKNLSKLNSWIAPPLENYIEGVHIKRDFRKLISYIELGIKRLKRIYAYF